MVPCQTSTPEGAIVRKGNVRFGSLADILRCGNDVRFTPKSRHRSVQFECPLRADTVEKVVSDPPKRNNRIRTARYLNRNCVRGRDCESMLRIQGRKIVFQQYRSIADIFHLRGRTFPSRARITKNQGKYRSSTRPPPDEEVCDLWHQRGKLP